MAPSRLFRDVSSRSGLVIGANAKNALPGLLWCFPRYRNGVNYAAKGTAPRGACVCVRREGLGVPPFLNAYLLVRQGELRLWNSIGWSLCFVGYT